MRAKSGSNSREGYFLMIMMRSSGPRSVCIRLSACLLVLGALLALTVAGCGGGGSKTPASVTGWQPPAPTTANLTLEFDLEPGPARQVPADIAQIRVTGYEQAGELAYGPEVRELEAEIRLTDVPVEVVSVRLEMMRGDGTYAGLYEESVDLLPGATKVIADPAWEDFANPPSLTRIEVTPGAASVAAGIVHNFTAVAVFEDNARQVLTQDATWTVADEAIASVGDAAGSKGQALGLAQGVTTVNATYAGVVGQATLTVTAAELVSLTVLPNPASVAAGRTQQFNATGLFTDNTTADLTEQVTWTSSNQGVATVESVEFRTVRARGAVPGLATGVAPGEATITATHAATGKSGTAQFMVTAAELTGIEVTPTNSSVAKGLTQQFTATGHFTDNTTQDLTDQVGLNWTTSDESVASISNVSPWKGQASTHAIGTVLITATDSLTGLSGQTELTVTAAELASIAVEPTNPSVPLGQPQQFVATGVYTDNNRQDLTAQVTWASSSPQTATVSNDPANPGQATPVAVGQTTITATDPTTSVAGDTVLTVSPAALVSIEVTPAASSIAKGRSQQFTATGTFSDTTTRDITQEVTWFSSQEAVATLSNAEASKGLALGTGVGQADVKAVDPTTQVEGSTILAVTPAELVSLQVTPAVSLLPLGTSQQMTCTGTFTDNTTQDLTGTVTWTSADGAIATVSNEAATKGLVTPVDLGGPIAIRATDPGTAIRAEANVEVVAAALASIAVTPVDPSIAKGRDQQFTATGTFSDQSTRDLTDDVTWSSGDEQVATITNDVPRRGAVPNVADGAGLATGLKVGQTTITATFPGTEITDSTVLTVTAAELVALEVLPGNPSVAKGRDQQFQATGTFSDQSTADVTEQVTWSSSAEGVATVSNAPGAKGHATGVNVGQASITATDPATQVTGSTNLTVTAAELVSIAVTPADASVEQLKTLQFTATGTYTDESEQNLTDTVTWSTGSVDIATISNADGSRGLATGLEIGQTTVIATDPATSIAGSTNLTVTEPPPPQLTVKVKNACLMKPIQPVPAGLVVRFVNRVDGVTRVERAIDANGEAVFTREEITPNVAWTVSVVSTVQCGESEERRGCWDGTHNNWPPEVRAYPDAPGEISLRVQCPANQDGCGFVPGPPPGSQKWGNALQCPGF